MPKLSFISDEKLEASVQHLLTVARNAKVNVMHDINRNVVDPFSILFQMSGFEISEEDWKESEMIRQAEKTLQNHIGEFHQKLLGGVSGWQNLGVGHIIDLESASSKVIAEVKNKYNTMSGGKLANLYKDLEDQVMPKHSKYKDYTAYYVEIIPKRKSRYNKEFTPSDKSVGGRCASNPLIRQIDGASFYAMVTGQEDALAQLFSILPEVIENICKNTNGYTFQDRSFAQSFFNAAFGE